MSIRLGPVVAGAFVAVLLVGCSSGTTATHSPNASPIPTISPTPTVAATPSPASSASAAAAKATIKLLSNWHQIDMTEAGLQGEIKVLQKNNPQVASQLQQILDSGTFKSISLYALGYSGINGIGNLNALSFDASGLNLDALLPQMQGSLENVGATQFTSSMMTLPAGDAMKMDYVLTVKGSAASTKLDVEQYSIMPGDGRVYVLTFTCYPSATAMCMQQVRSMIPTVAIAH